MEEKTDDNNRQAGWRGVGERDDLSSSSSPAQTTTQDALDAGLVSAVHRRPSEASTFVQQEGHAGETAETGGSVSLLFASVPRQGGLQEAPSTYSVDNTQPYSAHTSMDFLRHRGSFVPQSSSSQFAPLMPSASTASHDVPVAFAEAQNQMLTTEGLVDTVARMPAETETTDTTAIHSKAAIEPQENDVLYGRGKQHRKHPGNKRMKLLVDLHRDAYNKANRIAKTNMSNEIVNIIKSCGNKSGRFLRFDKKVNGWVEVSDESAREKISHAMRDGKTRPFERIDPKVLDEMPLLSDQIKQEALLKIAGSKPTGEASSQPLPAPGEEEGGPPVNRIASSDKRKNDGSEQEGVDRKQGPS